MSELEDLRAENAKLREKLSKSGERALRMAKEMRELVSQGGGGGGGFPPLRTWLSGLALGGLCSHCDEFTWRHGVDEARVMYAMEFVSKRALSIADALIRELGDQDASSTKLVEHN